MNYLQIVQHVIYIVFPLVHLNSVRGSDNMRQEELEERSQTAEVF